MTRYYYKPARVRMMREAERHSSAELVTPCRLLLVFIVSTAMVLLISFSVYVKDTRLEWDDSEDVNFTLKPYRYDFKSALKLRETNLEHYNRPSHMWSVERRSGLDIEEFWDLYDAKWPVIVTDAIQHWPAINWTRDYLLENYGKQRIMFKSVQAGKQYVTGHFLQLHEFVNTLHPSYPDTWNYMEDEMFLLRNPSLKANIGTHRFADENFFELFPYEIRPWDACFYWGAPFSRSELHMDPYNWTGTSAVISGKKLWKLFPPGQDRYLYIKEGIICGFPLDCNKYNSPIDAFDPDLRSYPKFSRTQYIEAELYPGEMLIIPTGWYHQAFNEEETISISSQMMNRNNYLVVLEEIIKARNIKRKKLPPRFDTLLPPEQIKLFLSLLPKKILKRGKEITDDILERAQTVKDTNIIEENPSP